jgi:hypothetical protein
MKVQIGVLFFCLISSFAFCQFTGGIGSGNTRFSSGFKTLSGSNDINFFSGGIGRGDRANKILPVTLNGANWNYNSLGGNGGGSTARASSQLSLSGQNPFAFPGGIGDGSSAILSNSISLNGENRGTNLDFKGGNGGGSFRASSAQLFLSGVSPNSTLTYFGGNGNGSTRSNSLRGLLLSGVVYNHPFSGGFGRGDRSLRSSRISLAGVIVPASVRIAQSAILDFFHIPDFENKKAHLKIAFQPQSQLKNVVIQKHFAGRGFVDHSKFEVDENSPERMDIPVDLKSETQKFRLLQVFKDSTQLFSDQIEIDPVQLDSRFMVYPNPANELLEVITTGGESILEIEVFDLHGKRQICPIEILMNGKFKVNLSALNSGLYALKVSSPSGIENIRFSKK